MESGLGDILALREEKRGGSWKDRDGGGGLEVRDDEEEIDGEDNAH